MTGLIRKIVVGPSPKNNAMAYYIGMAVGPNKVSTIVYDEEHLYRYHKNRFHVYVSNDKQEQILWKVIDEMPTMVEFDLDF